MYKLCKTEQSAKRQRQLENGLLKAMLQHQYEEISISDLCEQMEVPRKSFYRYFSSKDGALYALIDHTLMEFENFDKKEYLSEKRTLQRDMERFFRFWQHHSDLLSALEKSGLSGMLVQRSTDYALAELVFSSRFLPNEDRNSQNSVVVFAVCGLLTMVLRWHKDGYQTPIRQLAALSERLLTHPLFPDAGKML